MNCYYYNYGCSDYAYVKYNHRYFCQYHAQVEANTDLRVVNPLKKVKMYYLNKWNE